MISRIFISFLLCLSLWLAGLAWFVWQIPAQPLDKPPQADAIVVLTGGGGRLEYGLALLAEHKAGQLFISGVSENVTLERLLKQVPADSRANLPPEALQHITLGHQAENTIGNANETARWLEQKHFKTVLLVTGNYHMPRSVEEFAVAAPDITIIPAPVFPDNFTLAGWWSDADSRALVLSEYHKFIASKLRHWLIATHKSQS